jgi:hypothetical protein
VHSRSAAKSLHTLSAEERVLTIAREVGAVHAQEERYRRRRGLRPAGCGLCGWVGRS